MIMIQDFFHYSPIFSYFSRKHSRNISKPSQSLNFYKTYNILYFSSIFCFVIPQVQTQLTNVTIGLIKSLDFADLLYKRLPWICFLYLVSFYVLLCNPTDHIEIIQFFCCYCCFLHIKFFICPCVLVVVILLIKNILDRSFSYLIKGIKID